MAGSVKASKGLPGSASCKTRKARYDKYANEDRYWHNKLGRLARLNARALKANHLIAAGEYANAYVSVMARAPIQVRGKYKQHRLAA